MFFARDFRRIARDKLRGWWGKALLVTLVAGILMGVGTGISFNFSFPSAVVNGRYAFDLDGFADGFREGFNEGFNEGYEFTVPDIDVPGLPDGYIPDDLDDALDDIRDRIENVDPNDIRVFTTVFLSLIGVIFFFGLLFGLPLAFILSCVATSAQLGLHTWNITRTEGRQSEFVQLFSRFRLFFKAGLLSLFMSLFIWLWSWLLIVPGIIASYRYWAATWLMAEHPDMGVREAVNKSKEIMRGRKWRLFCLQLSFLGWDILNLFTFGIGSLWLRPYKNAAYAAFYYDATGRQIPVGDVSEPVQPTAPAQPVQGAPYAVAAPQFTEPAPSVNTEPFAPASEPEPYAAPAPEPEPYAAPASEPEPYAAPAPEPEPYTAPASEPEPYAAPAPEPEAEQYGATDGADGEARE